MKAKSSIGYVRVCAGLLMAVCSLVPAHAEEQGSVEFQQEKSELDAMLSKRELAVFEVAFEPLALERVLLVDRAGHPHAFQYLAFRIRNQPPSDASGSMPISHAKGYNEVLAQVAKEYDQAKVTNAGGVALTVPGTEGQDNVIVDRQDGQPGTRTLRLSFLAHDERGTRITLLDGTELAGTAKFDFPDLGDPTRGSVLNVVRERAEEALHQRLLTTGEISAIQLPPFDPAAKRTDEGWHVGELYGVAVFDVLSDYGRQWTVEVHGLTNKVRIHWPETEKGKVENYLDARFLRRTLVLKYEHLGDEYFRDRDIFSLQTASWEWMQTFQRQDKRRAMAYARYYLGNIATDKGDAVNPEVAKAFWTYYDEQRALYNTLPDIGKDAKAQ